MIRLLFACNMSSLGKNEQLSRLAIPKGKGGNKVASAVISDVFKEFSNCQSKVSVFHRGRRSRKWEKKYQSIVRRDKKDAYM